ncbi:MAG TPA: hypothetical protein VFD12_07855 [Oligella sp.]|nr:hypothetical protein [Oligella sp.]
MDNNGSYLDPKTVRMFYCLVLRDVIPHNPTVGRTEEKGGNLTDKEWEAEFCDSMNLQLEELLQPLGYQIAFDTQTGVRPFEKQQLTYLIPFLVSKVHEFKAENIIIPKPGYSGFKVEDRALSSVQEALAQGIRDTIGTNVTIHELVFSMVTSRSFVFEIFYEGSFRVKREFSDEDVESEGGVRDALESFFDEIVSAIEPFGFEITSTPSSRQRSRNNEYLFSVYYAPTIGFRESDVQGVGCYAIRGDASTDEVNEHGIDFQDSLVDEANALLNSTLNENLPAGADLISCEISYVDDPEEAFDICDDLIFEQNQYYEANMIERPENELKIVTPRDPLPTVEIDIDSIPEGLHGYSDLVTRALSAVAEESINLRATIYVYQGMSVNFHQQTWSVFFGVAGDKELLNVLLKAFQSAKVGNVRLSDYIDPSMATRDFHVHDGHVWRPLEAGTWYTESHAEKNLEENIVSETEDLELDGEITNGEGSRISNPTRFRVARADASIGSICKKIEEVFGVPEGAVKLCAPNGKPLRSDAKISTLRRRWEQ